MSTKKKQLAKTLDSIQLDKPQSDFKKLFDKKKEGIRLSDNSLFLDISLIVPNPNQPRRHFKKSSLEELAESIKERGVLQPIRVRLKNEKYEIIAGERRWQASKLAGLLEVPCTLVTQNDQESYIDSLMENIQREDLNPIDRANGLSELKVHLGGVSWDEVGQKLGLKRSHVFNLLGLKSLPENVQQDIKDGVLNEVHGRALKTLLSDEAKFKEAYSQIKTENLSGINSLALVKSLKNPPNTDIEKRYRSLKNAHKKYQDLLLFSKIQHFETQQKESIKKALLELQDIISEILEKA